MKRSNKKTDIKFNAGEFSALIVKKLSESIGDMVITVAITGITLAYMWQIIHPVYASTIPGFYLAGMFIQLFIRIVHRFDEEYTTNEVGHQLMRLEDEINRRLDNIIANIIS